MKEILTNYNGDTYIIKSKYDYDLYAIKLNKDKELSDCLCTYPKEGVVLIKNATKQGYLEATDGDGVDISSRMEYHRGTVQKESTQTLTTRGGRMLE